MISVYGDLVEKILRDPRMTARNGARRDLGILLFSRKDDIAALWKAASCAEGGSELSKAVEKLKSLFGERP
jgi:hypothetical protein